MKNFTAFADALPEQGLWVLVTNNIKGLSCGRNLWLVSGYHKNKGGYYYTFNDCDQKIHNLTHWKYALEEKCPKMN